MWHRLWQSVRGPVEAESGVVAAPPKIVFAALAAGMISGALLAPAPSGDIVAASAAPNAAAVDHDFSD